jgi:NAD(P)H-nitrite reductase large subunit
MKCIKAIRASKGVDVGDIKRVDEKTAMNMVGGSWQYISKTEWKLSRGNKAVEEISIEQVTAQTTEQVERKPYKKGSKPEKKYKLS